MGTRFTDKFSLLHFATGIIAYYWNISFLSWFIMHLMYEYIENTIYGMRLINKIPLWPGGKDHTTHSTWNHPATEITRAPRSVRAKR